MCRPPYLTSLHAIKGYMRWSSVRPLALSTCSLLLCNLFDASQIVLTHVFCAIAQCDADSHLFFLLLKGAIRSGRAKHLGTTKRVL